MRNKILYTIVLLMSSVMAISAQQMNKDSLEQIINNKNLADTNVDNAYSDLIISSAQKDKEYTLSLIKDANAFAVYRKDSLIIADILKAKGWAYKHFGHLDSAAIALYT